MSLISVIEPAPQQQEAEGQSTSNEVVLNSKQDFGISNTQLDALQEKYMALTINGIDDKEGYKAVDTARKDIRKKRFAVTNYYESIKRQLNTFKANLSSKFDLTETQMLLIEDHLEKQQQPIDEEKERIAEEKRHREAELIATRKAALLPFDFTLPDDQLKKLTDKKFESVVAAAKSSFLAKQVQEQARKAMEEKNNSQQQTTVAETLADDLPFVDSDAPFEPTLMVTPSGNLEEETGLHAPVFFVHGMIGVEKESPAIVEEPAYYETVENVYPELKEELSLATEDFNNAFGGLEPLLATEDKMLIKSRALNEMLLQACELFVTHYEQNTYWPEVYEKMKEVIAFAKKQMNEQ